jgi:predicted Zn-dependent protease
VRKTAGVGRFVAICLACCLAFTGGPAEAQRRLQFLRDAETEHIIRTMARPIFEAAGVDPDAVQIVLVNDQTLNAFVAGGQNIFLHTGLLLQAEDPLQLLGVIAHETGHIAGGHLIRSREAIDGASAQALLSLLLGVGAAIATGQAGAAMGGALGGAEVARRSLFSFSRGQENAADQAGLVYLEKAGISPRGMLTFLEFLAGEEGRIQNRQQVEYTTTHPLTPDRIDAVRYALERSRNADRQLPEAIVEQHRRMRAKLLAFVQPAQVARRFPESDRSIVAGYARAYAAYRRNDIPRALRLVEELIAAEPRNPFFHELKGQMLFENGRVTEAVGPYRDAVALFPDSALLQTAYAHALLESQIADGLPAAVRALETSLRFEPRSPETWRLLSIAYNRQGDTGRTAYATAEAALSRGDTAAARVWSDRAMAQLPRGSPAWLRAQDIRIAVGEPGTLRP